MATLDMQGTIPEAKSEKVLASWAGHSIKKRKKLREAQGRTTERGGYGEDEGVIKEKKSCYFRRNIILPEWSDLLLWGER